MVMLKVRTFIRSFCMDHILVVIVLYMCANTASNAKKNAFDLLVKKKRVNTIRYFE